MVVCVNSENGSVLLPSYAISALKGRVHFANRIEWWDDARSMVDKLTDSFVRQCMPDASAAEDISSLRSKLEGKLQPAPDFMHARSYLICDHRAFPVRWALPNFLQFKPSAIEVWTLSYYIVEPPLPVQVIVTANDPVHHILPHVLRQNSGVSTQSPSTMVRQVLSGNGMYVQSIAPLQTASYSAFRNKDPTDPSTMYTMCLPSPLRVSAGIGS